MKASITKLGLLFVGILAGCSEWPPHAEELKIRFTDSREEIGQLAQELKDSKFVDMRIDLGGGVIGHYFEGEKWEEGNVPSKEPEHSARWAALFDAAGMESIAEHYDGDISLGLNIYFGGQESSSNVQYVRSSSIQDKYVACSPNFRNVECGDCIVSIEPKWWIRYSWHPAEFAPDLWQALIDDEITSDEYYEKSDENREICYAEGKTHLNTSID